MVIGWLMEYSLRYDLTHLRSELKNLFPKLVLELKLPNEDALYRHAGKFFIRTTKFDAKTFYKKPITTPLNECQESKVKNHLNLPLFFSLKIFNLGDQF